MHCRAVDEPEPHGFRHSLETVAFMSSQAREELRCLRYGIDPPDQFLIFLR